jgi:hypothetical protein
VQGVRDGTWYHKSNAGELDSADSLQQLAALMDEPAPAQDPWQQEEQEAAAVAAATTPPRSPAGAAAQQLQELQLCDAMDAFSPVFKQDSLRQRFSRPASRQDSAHLREEHEELQAAAAAAVAAGQQVSAAAVAAGRTAAAEEAAAADESADEEEVDEYEGSEEQRQYLELEREVQQMLEATSAAAAAAAHMQSASDQQYLSEILGEQLSTRVQCVHHASLRCRYLITASNIASSVHAGTSHTQHRQTYAAHITGLHDTA